ncbi:MAG TPA: TIGR00730 family Rossman fold protein [Dysgonomonas sp.]|nr:TIGR00730 family Rossman fold protein [Dysgonomonas sp.]
MNRIAVYCGSSSGSNEIFKVKAYETGKALAQKNIELVYGGAKVGLMGAVADGVLDNGGKAIGVLPHFLAEKELQHISLTEIIFVETMHERKAKMSELSDGFIGLPGGFGTMEELFEMLTWAQLSLHKKPIGILNISGYYDSLIQFIQTMYKNGFLKEDYLDLLIVSSDIDDLLQKMQNYEPIKNEKWFVVK